MPTNDIFLDGTGKFQQSTENAGVIKFGEFTQTSINTGNIAISALFTGSAVNSGTIGDYLPYDTAVIVQSYSADWNTAYQFASNGGGGAIEITTADISDYLSTTTDLITSLAPEVPVTSVAGRTGAVIVTTADLADFNTAADARITAAAGTSLATLVGGTVPSSQLPSYVDDVKEYVDLASFPGTGTTDVIYVDTTSKKIYRWSGSVYIEISPSPGSTDAVTEGVTNLYFTNVRASAAAPVQSVAGKTGVVVLSSSDVVGLQAAVEAFTPDVEFPVDSVAGKTGAVVLSSSDVVGLQAAVEAFAPAQAVSSVAGKTGVVSLSTSDIVGLAAVIAASSNITSVAGRTGVVVLSASDITGFAASADALIDVKLSTVVSNSAAWQQVYSKVITTSATWQQAYTNVNTNSAAWANTITSVAGRTGAVVITTADLSNFNTATDARISTAAGTSVAALVNGTVPASQLPSYVDDVLEYSALASFPATGETGKIYVDTTTKKIYRWSGTAYVEIAASPGSTDSVTEGPNNLYFTNARADARLTVLNTNSAAWQQVYTNVNVNSASWTSTNFGSVSATAVSLSNATLSSYSTPVTASGEFIVITVANKQRLIRLWDFK